MTARVLPRSHGVVIRCNHGASACPIKFITANVYIGVNRKAAASMGWIRGGAKDLGGSGKRLDFCPKHAPGELGRVKAKTAAREQRRRIRDARRKAHQLAVANAAKEARHG